MGQLEGDVGQPAEAKNVPTIPVPPSAPVTKFHVGLRPGAPAWFHNIFGICFPQTSSIFDDDGTEHRKTGSVAELDANQLRKVRDGIKNRIVRWTRGLDKNGKERRIRGEIWDRTTFGFRPERGDEPLAPYLIFEKIAEEFAQPPTPEVVFVDLEEAIKAAEASENLAVADPRDAKLREKHGRAKATGSKLDDDQLGV